MSILEKVSKGLECHVKGDCAECPYREGWHTCNPVSGLFADAIALLKAQETRRRLEVHNIGNVDIPEGVTWEQFQAVMSNVVEALEHTDRGESWPYEETGSEDEQAVVCRMCGERFTEDNLRELRGFNEPYWRDGEMFICPDCWGDLQWMDLDDQAKLLILGGKKRE